MSGLNCVAKKNEVDCELFTPPFGGILLYLFLVNSYFRKRESVMILPLPICLFPTYLSEIFYTRILSHRLSRN